MLFVFQLLARLPLWLLHGAGAVLGWMVFWLSPSYRHRFLDNAAQAGLSATQWRPAVAAAGQLTLELPRLWLGRPVPVRWVGAALVEAALAQGRGVVFITPHLGCFEIAAQAYGERFGASHPMTALYRPARQAWLAALQERARARPGLRTAPTSRAGVKQMLKALQQGHCVGLLPDQVPPLHQGVWASFFGKPAYTMTLSARLAQQTGAVTLLAWGERLSWGRGYVVHVLSPGLPQGSPVLPWKGATPAEAPTQAEAGMTHLNQSLEALVRQHPGQYLWGYARYKAPVDPTGARA